MSKILIVDDDRTIREILIDIVKSLGHEYLVAEDGEEGEKLAREKRPNLIILDVVMPKKNGYQVCRDLKRDEDYKSIPIILLSAKDQDSDKFWGRKQGADEYLTKPFQEEELIKVIKKYVS